MPMIKWRVEPTKLTKNSFNSTKCPADFSDLANDVCTNIILQLSCLCKHSQDLFNELEQQATKIANRTNQLNNRVKGLKEKAAKLNPTVEEVSLDDIILCKPYKSSNIKDASLQDRPNAVLEIYAKSQPIPALDKLNPFRSLDEKDCVKLYSNPDFFFESWCGQVKQEVEKIRPARKKRQQKTQAKPERIPQNRKLEMMRKKVEDEIGQPKIPAAVPAATVQPTNNFSSNQQRKISTSSASSDPTPPSPLSPKPIIHTKPLNIIQNNSKTILNRNSLQPSMPPPPPPPPNNMLEECSDSVIGDALPHAPFLKQSDSEDFTYILPPPPASPASIILRPSQNRLSSRATLYSVGDFDRNTLILPPPPDPLVSPTSTLAPAAPPPPPAPTLPSPENAFQLRTAVPARNQSKKMRESRGDLLHAIRNGIQLRKVDETKQDVREQPIGGGLFDVQTIMEMRRKALEEEDEEDDQDFNDWDEE